MKHKKLPLALTGLLFLVLLLAGGLIQTAEAGSSNKTSQTLEEQASEKKMYVTSTPLT